MVILNSILVLTFLALSVWLIPGMLGGLITTFALRREKGSIQAIDIVAIAGRWMVACFLGGLILFISLRIIIGLLPEEATVSPAALMFIEYFCFGAGAALIGARGAKIILEVLEYS